MRLSNSFIATMRNVFKEDGEKFLAILPSLIEESSHRWDLTDVRPVPNLSYNFVAYATSSLPPLLSGKGNVILKIGMPNRELTSEMNALRLFDGKGACQLLDCDEERGILLLERLQPGTTLSELEDDDERTNIAADMMRRLWRDVPEDADGFIKLSDWFNGLKKIRPRFAGGTGPFPKEVLERVESFLPQVFNPPSVLMHGDFHHFNVLKSERGWLVIDPKGVIGPAGYEVGPLMLNPRNSPSDWNRFKVQTWRRVSILSERLGWPRETIIQWSLAHAVLSAWWDLEDGMDWKYPLACAEIFSEIK
jgi:streptomycin 6-kinase